MTTKEIVAAINRMDNSKDLTQVVGAALSRRKQVNAAARKTRNQERVASLKKQLAKLEAAAA